MLWQVGEEGWVEEPMVLVLLLEEAFVSMIYNFKKVGRARGVGAEAWDRGLTLGSKH